MASKLKRIVLWGCCAVLAACKLGPSPGPADAAPVAEEVVSVATIPADLKHVVYLPDGAFNHMVDSLVRVVDGDSLRYLGTMSLGDLGLFGVSRDGASLYTASTYYERLNRGKRTDTVAIYDARTLQLTREIVIPPKHAQEVPYQAFLVPSWTGPYLFVQNATPASSVTVVDTAAGTVLAEVQTAGCYGIFPSPLSALRFSSLCGDGSAITITLDASGKEVSREHSEKLFDPDADALFEGAADAGNEVLFISFNGVVHVIDISGSVARQSQPLLPIVDADLAREGWRPGGEQVIAYQVASQQLFVTMHRHGKEGSHKQPADEIWQVDLKQRAVVRRIAGSQAQSLAVTQDAHPLLFAVGAEDGSLSRYDVDNGLTRSGEIAKPLLESASTIFVH